MQGELLPKLCLNTYAQGIKHNGVLGNVPISLFRTNCSKMYFYCLISDCKLLILFKNEVA